MNQVLITNAHIQAIRAYCTSIEHRTQYYVYFMLGATIFLLLLCFYVVQLSGPKIDKVCLYDNKFGVCIEANPLINKSPGRREIERFAESSAAHLLSFNFATYAKDIETQRYRFTDEAYDEYINALIENKVPQDLEKHKQVVTAVNKHFISMYRMMVDGDWVIIARLRIIQHSESIRKPSEPIEKTVNIHMIEVDRHQSIFGLKIIKFLVSK